MLDRVPKYPGRVRLTPVPGQENTFDMTRADESTQAGDPLNKATFLKDATAAIFGLNETAVPDDVFSVLSRFQAGMGNEYLWSKTKSTDAKYSLVSGGQVYGSTLLKTAENVRYYDSISLDGDKIVGSGGGTTYATNVATLIGKYVGPDGSAGFSSWAKLTWYSYPEEYTIRYSGESYHVTTGVKTILYGYVNSPFANAYPPLVPDGFTYNPLGRLGGFAKIETGSYVGTGAFGASNPCKISLPFAPKFILITNQKPVFYASNTELNWFFWMPGMTEVVIYGGYPSYITVTNEQFSWFNTRNAGYQANLSGVTYDYFIVG